MKELIPRVNALYGLNRNVTSHFPDISESLGVRALCQLQSLLGDPNPPENLDRAFTLVNNDVVALSSLDLIQLDFARTRKIFFEDEDTAYEALGILVSYDDTMIFMDQALSAISSKIGAR